MDETMLYDAYLRTFAKVRSGHKLTDQDFGTVKEWFTPFTEEEKVAATIAAEDAAAQGPMRTKKDLLQRVRELLG